MSVIIKPSKFWWQPLTMLAECEEHFQQFHIINLDIFMRHLVDCLIKDDGIFLFAFEEGLSVPVAATAISFEGDVLRVHFYWSLRNMRPSVFNNVHEYCLANDKNVDYVQYPQPLKSFDKVARRYAEISPDEYGRLILWHKFRYVDFMSATGVWNWREKERDITQCSSH